MNKYISDSRGILAIPLMAMFSSPVVPNIADVLSEKNGGIVIEDEVDVLYYQSAGITFAEENDLANQLLSFASKFISSQKPMDEDALRILEENLWDLV